MLKQRVITAVILATVFVGTILLADHPWVIALFALALLASSYELISLTIKPGIAPGLVMATLFALIFWLTKGFFGPSVLYWLALCGALIWVGVLGYLLIYRFSGHWSPARRLGHFLLGSGMLWICVQGLVFMHGHFEQGGWMLLYLLSLVWVADIGAYFSGRRFGRHKLAPGISPGKTWEGVAGGILFNLGWMLLVFQLSDGWGISLWPFILIGLSTSCISVVGDLYESILKREAAVKDSGKLLPGHGGVLDRIDSVISATPVFVLGLYLAGAV